MKTKAQIHDYFYPDCVKEQASTHERYQALLSKYGQLKEDYLGAQTKIRTFFNVDGDTPLHILKELHAKDEQIAQLQESLSSANHNFQSFKIRYSKEAELTTELLFKLDAKCRNIKQYRKRLKRAGVEL